MVNDAQLERLAGEGFGLRPTAPIRPMAAGNINSTAVVETDHGSFVLQELNTVVFSDPDALMGNAIAIVERLHRANLPTMEFRPNVDGGWLVDLDGIPWRCYRHVDGHATPAVVTPEEAQSMARAFGRFAAAIADLTLAEHLPGYHDFDARVRAFEEAIEADAVGRVASSGDAIDVAIRMVDRLRLSSSYESWFDLPRRNAHNDAKAPNCVVSDTGSRTIIDLDTTMPGTILSDVGELVRSCTRALENPDPADVMVQIESVNRGFIAGFGGELSDAETSGMLLAGPLLTVENAIRFLTDHLHGDPYYGAAEPDHNLGRAGAQLRLAETLVQAIEEAVVL